MSYTVAPVVTPPPLSLTQKKSQNEDILATANIGPPGKWPLKWSDTWDSLLLYNIP